MINNKKTNSRRIFLRNAALLGVSAIALPKRANAFQGVNIFDESMPKRILFQGDSITDGGRGRNLDWNHVMGHGYQYIIASKLWFDFPKKQLMFFNRGISGNRVPDLLQRWENDTISLKPEVLSILIGINDTTAQVNGNPAFTEQSFETDYRKLLELTKNALPGIKLIMCEPFILPVGKVKDKWEAYYSGISTRQKIVKSLAEEFNAIFVPFQQTFNDALKRAPAEYWIWDGIHPMPAGHQLMAMQWMKIVHKNDSDI